MSQKQSNKLIVDDKHYNLYCQFVQTPHKKEGTTKQAKQKKLAKKTSRQLLYNKNFGSCSCILCKYWGRQSSDMETDKNNENPAEVETAQPNQTTEDMETDNDDDHNRKPAAVETPQKKRKSEKKGDTTGMSHDKTAKPWTDVASLPTIEQGNENSTGEEDILMTPKGKKSKIGGSGSANKGVGHGSGGKSYSNKKQIERTNKLKNEKGEKYRDDFNNKRRETYHAVTKGIADELKKCDIKAFKLGGENAQVEHLPPPDFSSEERNKETTETTLKLLKGFGKFLVDNYEETVEPLLNAMVKKEGTNAVVPQKPAVAIIDGGRWEIFIDNLKTNQSTRCWDYLLEVYLDTSKEGNKFLHKGPKGKHTLVKNKALKFKEMVTKYMKCQIEKNCTGYTDSGKNLQLSLRSVIFHPTKVESQKVHTDMHRDGIQFILQMYTGKAGEDEEYPLVATEEYKLPDGCLEKSGKRMLVKKIAWEDLLSQWPGMEEDCRKELMDVINGQEKKEDINHVILVLQNHAVPLLLESDKTWTKLGGNRKVGKKASGNSKKKQTLYQTNWGSQ